MCKGGVTIFPTIMSQDFVSTLPVAMLPISALCLTASALVYGIIKMRLSFLVVVKRTHEIRECGAIAVILL